MRIVYPLCEIFRFNIVCLEAFLSQLLKYLISQIATGYSVCLCIDDFCYIVALRRRFVSHFNEARRCKNRLWRDIWCRLMTHRMQRCIFAGCDGFAYKSIVLKVARYGENVERRIPLSAETLWWMPLEIACGRRAFVSASRFSLAFTPATGQTGHSARSAISIFCVNDKIMRVLPEITVLAEKILLEISFRYIRFLYFEHLSW